MFKVLKVKVVIKQFVNVFPDYKIKNEKNSIYIVYLKLY